jgi:hypothetical protein
MLHKRVAENLSQEDAAFATLIANQDRYKRVLSLRRLMRKVIAPPSQFFPIHIEQLIAIVTLGVLFWLLLGVPKHIAPLQGYPYYDVQKPLPPWTEPGPLQGNYGRERR